MNNTYQGLVIIKRWESCKLRAYKPLPEDKWTVGWGATGPNIVDGTTWTQDQADADLANRLILLGNQLLAIIKVPVNDNQFGAMLSLAYNIGIGLPDTDPHGPSGLRGSTLLKLLNQGDIQGASQQFLVWNKSDGKYVQGLMNRREDEQHVFNTTA